MNIQEIFDTVSVHLLTQNKKSQESSFYSSCLYRGPNGLKCAVGCLIKDEFYNIHIENYSSDAECVIKALGQSGIIIDDEITEILYDLQDIHDTCWACNWHKLLYLLALDYDLSPDILTQFGDISEYEKISDL